MEKRMKYDFELKFKFLKFLYWARVMPPSPTFSKKWIIEGDMTPENTVYKIILF